jgi:hypothetical protein
MMEPLDKKQATLKTGQELLTFNEMSRAISLIDFWRWSVSDILSNATRGRFAEFIVATATNVDIRQCRDEWNSFDLETPEGIKLEIKSAAYLQSWFQKTLSKINFSIKAAQFWDSISNKSSTTAARYADVYVFCLLHHNRKQTVDPLNMNHWEFYVLATKQLNEYKRSKHSITLKSLQAITNPVTYDGLRNEIIVRYNIYRQ